MPFDVDHTVELRNPEAIKRLVLKSRGVGVLARSAVAQEVVEGRLVELKVTDLNVPMPYVLYSRVGGQVRPVEDYFCLLLRKYVSGHQYRQEHLHHGRGLYFRYPDGHVSEPIAHTYKRA